MLGALLAITMWADSAVLFQVADVALPGRATRFDYQSFDRTTHTVSVDPETHEVYLPLENVNGRPVLRIMKPTAP